MTQVSPKSARMATSTATAVARSMLLALLAAAGLAQAAPTNPRIGVQLWSVQDELKKDFDGTLAKIAQLGIEGVEFAGEFGPYHSNPAGLKAALARHKLACAGAHTFVDKLTAKQFDATATFYKSAGCDNLIVAYDKRAYTVKGGADLARELTALSAKLASRGMKIGFHNHAEAFAGEVGKTPWDVIAQGTPALSIMQQDVGWTTAAGKDPVAYVKRYPGRTVTTHYKPKIAPGGRGTPIIGQDSIDWAGLTQAARTVGGTDWLIIEQEDYPNGMGQLESVAASLKGLQAVMAKLPGAAPKPAAGSGKVSVTRSSFGKLSNGAAVEAVQLTNRHGLSATLITYGATVQSLRFPDERGVSADLAVGYDTIAGYETTPGYTNVTIGRYANRIAGAAFSLDGNQHRLSVNEAPNLLHGGAQGWDKRNWAVKAVKQGADAASVTFTLTSPDGDQGFPGTVVADVTYELTDNNDLAVHYHATTDRPTVINLTNHSMLNLGGIPASHLATDAELTIAADTYLPIDRTLIPTGAGQPVAGTPFDFRSPAAVTPRVRARHDQLAIANGGIDHNYILRGGKTATPKLAVTLEDHRSGRGMTIATTEPGMQVYTGNFLAGKLVGKGGQRLAKYQAITFEAQGFPDSPNQPSYPSARLNPGETYRQSTVHHFYHLK